MSLLLGAVGIGLVVGYALLTRYGSRASMPALPVGGFLVSSAGNFMPGFAWAVAAAFTVQAVRGLGRSGPSFSDATPAKVRAALIPEEAEVGRDLDGRVMWCDHRDDWYCISY